MTTGNRKVEFNIEEKLASVNMTPADRHRALGAMRAAEDLVDFLDTLVAAGKRIAGVFSFKPSVRA